MLTPVSGWNFRVAVGAKLGANNSRIVHKSDKRPKAAAFGSSWSLKFFQSRGFHQKKMMIESPEASSVVVVKWNCAAYEGAWSLWIGLRPQPSKSMTICFALES